MRCLCGRGGGYRVVFAARDAITARILCRKPPASKIVPDIKIWIYLSGCLCSLTESSTAAYQGIEFAEVCWLPV